MALSVPFLFFLSRVTRAGLIEDVGGADLALTEREEREEKEERKEGERERGRSRGKGFRGG